MSFHSNDTAEETILQASQISESWEQEVVPSLPKNLEEQAWRLGAMSRNSGKVRRASDVLRGILAYVLVVRSFRALGGWGVIAGVADLAGTSWRERVQKSGNWLRWLLNEQLRPERQEANPILQKAGYEVIELVDASQLKCVGERGKVFRFHCLYSLCGQQLHQVIVSSAKVAESLMNFCVQKGAVYVHDSAYGYRRTVAAADEAEAYTVTAFYPGSFPMEDEQGKEIVLITWLKGLRAKERAIRSRAAFFWENGKRYEVRVIALRRTKEQTQREIQRKKKSARKQHRKLQKETIYLAHWLLIVTTLPATDWSDQEVVRLYRARWQIEMLFKRVKQLLQQHRLRARTEEIAKTTVTAIIVSWLLQQEVSCQMRSLLTEMYQELEQEESGTVEDEGKLLDEVSEWRLQEISVNLLRQQVQGPMTRKRILACIPQLERHLRDSPRKRVPQWRQVRQWLVLPQSGEDVAGSGKSRKTGSALTAALA